MHTIVRIVDRLVSRIGTLAGVIVLLMMLQITIEVTLRYFFTSSLGGTIEIVSNYYMVAIGFLSLAPIEISSRHIEVDLFTQNAGPRARRLIRLFVSLASGVIMSMMMIRAWQEAVKKFSLNANVLAGDFDLPVWPAYFIVPAGCALILLVLILKVVLDVIGRPYSDLLTNHQEPL